MERVFDVMLHIYSVSLRWVLRHRPVMLAMFVAVLGVTGCFYVIVPKGFIPDTDNDNFNVQVEAAQGTSYYQMVGSADSGVDRGSGSGRGELLRDHRWRVRRLL